MNKRFKKIAAIAACAVLASSMASTFTGCIPGATHNYSQEQLRVNVNDENRLTWKNGLELVCNIGYETSSDTAISFTSQNSLTPAGTELVLPDGKTYSQGDLKPAWQALEDKLHVQFIDEYVPAKSDDSIDKLITDTNDERLYTDENGNLVSDETHCLWDYDIITGSCAAIQSAQATSPEAKFLDLSLYLDYMPNYKAFLNDNPLIYLSLITDTDTGAMYYAPYFDGNDDIEKYTMIQKSWAYKLLDVDYTDVGEAEDDTTTFKEQAEMKNSGQSNISTKSTVAGDNVVIDGTRSFITSFMGTTGRTRIEVISPTDPRMRNKDYVYVDYSNALEAATDDSTPLGKSIKQAAGMAYTGNSGNIVDLQNFVINETHGEVTGLQLVSILQNYIDAAYLTSTGAPYYSKERRLARSDIFCGVSAAWDVDLLAAMSRCVVTGLDLLGNSVSSMQSVSDLFALGGRSSFTQRIADMYALAGELYGVRGLESRYEFTYIDADGTVRDARENTATWEAMNRLSAFAKEGLLYTGDVKGTDRSVYSTKSENIGPVYFLEHDYVQTQTLYQMRLDPEISMGTYMIPADYEFSPIITAVSRWNDGSGAEDNFKVMRFSESWRSVKNTGFAIPYQSVSNNPERLSAVLAFIDLFFSKDGQILMSYGPQSESGNESPDGWWYAEELAEYDLTDTTKFRKIADKTNYLEAQYENIDGTCFVYNGKAYVGLDYAGRQIPIMTDDNINCFKGKGFGGHDPISSYTLNYTNYARKVIGSALPIGNKDQGFEYQCTAECGLEGADVVGAALNKAGVIKHVYQQLENSENSLWYVIMPTLLPLSTEASETLKEDGQKAIDGLFKNSSSEARNALVRVMYNGFANGTLDGTTPIPSSAQGIVDMLNGLGMSVRTKNVDDAWQKLRGYYEAHIKQHV